MLLSAVFLAFALVEWGVGELLLLPRFEQIERDNAATAMKRIDGGLSQALAGLQNSSTDWGNWVASYRFMLDHNAAFERENLNSLAMREVQVTALAFIDVNGNIRWSKSLAPQSWDPLSLDLVQLGPYGVWVGRVE